MVVPEALRLRKAKDNDRENGRKLGADEENRKKRVPQLAFFSSFRLQPFSRFPPQTAMQYLNILISILNIEFVVQ